MKGYLPAAVVAVFVAAAFMGTASGSSEREGDLPTYFLDWADLAAADTAPILALAPGPEGTCSARLQSSIELTTEESGRKAIVLEPVPLSACLYQAHATFDAEPRTTLVGSVGDAASSIADTVCHVLAVQCTHEAMGAPEVHVPEPGSEDVEATWCRLADGWAHTGYPDPPTVVYTRVYQDMQLCWNNANAWIEELSGVCFANPSSQWVTDPDECYFSDWETGPAAEVYLTVHGYFEKDTGQTFRPFHDMWNTVHGKAKTGNVYCTGDIVGDYDGYVTVDNCGATAPERQ